MSTAEIIKQLKVKTGSAKRFHKEFTYYEKERDKEQAKVEKMKTEGADAHDLKQAENVLKESSMMIPDTRQRLEAALADLQSYISENDAELQGTEELAAAKEVVEAVEALFNS